MKACKRHRPHGVLTCPRCIELTNAADNEPSPYRRGFRAALVGERCPPQPAPNDSWTARLYASGWTAGNRAIAADAAKERELNNGKV